MSCQRLGAYGLALHPEKTQRIDFRVHYQKENKRHGLPSNFDFRGFTHFSGKTRKGGVTIFRKTAKGRVVKALKTVNEYCCKYRRDPLNEQYTMLKRKFRGHFAYFGITANLEALKRREPRRTRRAQRKRKALLCALRVLRGSRLLSFLRHARRRESITQSACRRNGGEWRG